MGFGTCNVILHEWDMVRFGHDTIECARNGFRYFPKHLKVLHLSLIACGSVESRELGASIVEVGLAFRPIGSVHTRADPLGGEVLPSIHS